MGEAEDLQRLAEALAQAEADHLADLQRLEEMSEKQILYLARAAEIEDPESDDLEADCI